MSRYAGRRCTFTVGLALGKAGPVLATAEELRAALADLDTVHADHASAYRRFTERFCPLDDGETLSRVVDALFAS